MQLLAFVLVPVPHVVDQALQVYALQGRIVVGWHSSVSEPNSNSSVGAAMLEGRDLDTTKPRTGRVNAHSHPPHIRTDSTSQTFCGIARVEERRARRVGRQKSE